MVVIKFEDVSKKYKLYSKGGLYLRDRITHALGRLNPFNGHSGQSSVSGIPSSPVSSPPSPIAPLERDFWALKNVSFEIKRGESIGFIGRNGAGKSTILKLLAGVTKATSGAVTVNGKVAALIEVGAGFHPELTGRENIFLNGSILGMKKVEIEKCFDSIVAFAELEEFIDTPVKHYSSGMYVRLGFAIAAHTNPDIYLIDEVLAVGDEAFQKKCLDTLAEHKAAGKTMILVSHSLDKVEEVCDRCIYMNHGAIGYDGASSAAIKQYRKDVGHNPILSQQPKKMPLRARREWGDRDPAPGNAVARLRSVSVRSDDGQLVDVIDIRRPLKLEMEYDVLKAGRVLVPNFHFYNEAGVCVFVVNDHDPAWMRNPRPAGRYSTRVEIPGNFLAEGRLFVAAALSTMDPVEIHFNENAAVIFEVRDSLAGDSARGDYKGPMPGFVRPLLQWETEVEGQRAQPRLVGSRL